MLHWLLAAALAAAGPTSADTPSATIAEAEAKAPKVITLACSGSYTPIIAGVTEPIPPRPNAFELKLDFNANTAFRDGRAWVLRRVTDDEIVISEYKPGPVSLLLSDAVTTISRKTGIYRNQYGRGTCEVRETKNLF